MEGVGGGLIQERVRKYAAVQGGEEGSYDGCGHTGTSIDVIGAVYYKNNTRIRICNRRQVRDGTVSACHRSLVGRLGEQRTHAATARSPGRLRGGSVIDVVGADECRPTYRRCKRAGRREVYVVATSWNTVRRSVVTRCRAYTDTGAREGAHDRIHAGCE
jgi:hypothetical protein